MKHKMMILVLIGLGFHQTGAMADMAAYPSFSKNSIRYVFPDFKTANYHIIYNAEKKNTTYQATIILETKEKGRILFDVVQDPLTVTLDGKSTKAEEIKAPDDASYFRSTSELADVGTHELKIEGNLKELLSYQASGVRSAFWLNDLYDRSYLEKFLPASFEYDRVAMKFEIEVLGTAAEHRIMTNGEVIEKNKNLFSVTYPDYYTSSSIFFHMLPKKRIHSEEFEIKTKDGGVLPTIIYYSMADGESPNSDGEATLKRCRIILEKKAPLLESKFGKFLHAKLLVYAADGGAYPGIAGMEYAGATMTNEYALYHELIHSYFGRGIMPANGNAGWLDEAITSWGEETDFIPQVSTTVINPQMLFTQREFSRVTHRGAYSYGQSFITQVAGMLQKKRERPLTDFLSDLIAKHSFQPYTNQDFFNWSKEFYGFSLLELVTKPVWDEGFRQAMPYTHQSGHFHRRFTDQELQKLL